MGVDTEFKIISWRDEIYKTFQPHKMFAVSFRESKIQRKIFNSIWNRAVEIKLTELPKRRRPFIK